MLTKRTKRQADTLVIPEGFYQELYTPSVGKITSPGLGIVLEYVKIYLTADSTVTWKDMGGNITTLFSLKAGTQPFLIKELHAVTTGSVLIIHDGIPAATNSY